MLRSSPNDSTTPRAFKTAWFARAARKAGIPDSVLVSAVAHARLGQVKDLGGNVFKKRLAGNLYRAILLGPGRKRWFFVYLFAKQNRANITADELRALRKLANEFGNMTETELTQAQEYGDLLELTHDH